MIMAFGALIGAVGGLLGNAQQSSNIDKSISAQQQENQKNREYNYWLAKQQNDWNLQQWQRENEYNSPSAQMARFRQAGLNTDMMMSNGAQNLSAQSPQMTSGAPSSPADLSALSQKPTIAQALNSALNASATVATVENTRSGTKKQYNDIKWQDLLGQNEIDFTDVKIRLGEKQIITEDRTAQNLLKIGKNLDQQFRLFREQVNTEITKQRDYNASASLKRGQLKLTQKQEEMLDKELSVFEEKFKIEKEVARAQVAQLFAAAAQSKELALVYKGQAWSINFENKISEVTRLTDEQLKDISYKEHKLDLDRWEVDTNHAELSEFWPLVVLNELTACVGRVFGGSGIQYSMQGAAADAHNKKLLGKIIRGL